MPMSGYEINEKDIDTVLGILKRSDPENATPEMAIAILERLQANIHLLSHTDPEKLIEIFNELKKQKKKKN
jgi:hypothetical protein